MTGTTVTPDPQLAAFLDAADAVWSSRAGAPSAAESMARARRHTGHEPLPQAMLARVVAAAMMADLAGAVLTAKLTPREREVFALVAEGLPNRAIAARLVLSCRTVEKHVERLLAKTGTTNRTQMVSNALQRAP